MVLIAFKQIGKCVIVGDQFVVINRIDTIYGEAQVDNNNNTTENEDGVNVYNGAILRMII